MCSSGISTIRSSKAKSETSCCIREFLENGGVYPDSKDMEIVFGSAAADISRHVDRRDPEPDEAVEGVALMACYPARVRAAYPWLLLIDPTTGDS